MISERILRTPVDLRSRIQAARATGARVALVPTMGALHGGHLSLVQIGKARADVVIASIFVNPAQFSPSEDFQAYPRDESRDVSLLASSGCDLVYAPRPEAVYPTGFSTTVNVTGVSASMEGTVRPHHFAGVATIVAKLLIQTSPHIAVFGEKDYQQLQVVRRLARDLDLGVEIVGGPIVREADGLALSSRNAYLTLAQRRVAPNLHASLVRAAKALTGGAEVADVEAEGASLLQQGGFDLVDYFEVRDPDNLERLGPGALVGRARILAAARLGRTRLIDNIAA